MKTAPSAPPQSFAEALRELSAVLEACQVLTPAVDAASRSILDCLKQGGKVLTCGNGGSAADALHMAGEFVGRYRFDRRALPAVCLCADTAAVTGISNDEGYERVFARGVEALGAPGDILVAFSTSGDSANVIAALETARARGLKTILVGGRRGGGASAACDLALVVPSESVPRIQEVHTLIMHQLLEATEAHAWK